MIFSKKKNKKKVFIDSGFLESQYLWLIPIVDGYCKIKGITHIVFQKELSPKLKKNKEIKNFFLNYNVEYLEKNNFNISKFVLLFFCILMFPYCLIKLNRKTIISEKNWFKSQIFHALWDTSLNFGKDGELNPKIINLFKSFFLIMRNFYLVYILQLKHSVHTGFLSHSVYQGRVFLAVLRRTSKIFCQSAFNIYEQPSEFDESWSILRNDKNLNLILKSISDLKSEEYWNKRITGKGALNESNIINKFENKKLDTDFNILMLHVFKDSSFNFIDNNRIFSDYIDWVFTTLKILKNTNETWLIRAHPFSTRWGEDSLKFIDQIKKKLEINNRNIKLLENNISNNLIFNKAKRIVTYAGTAFLEYACYGKKAIIISDVLPDRYQKKITFKPNNILEYKNLLIDDIHLNKFKLDEKYQKLSKKILYARENITNLAKDTGGFFVYRNDNESIKLKEYESVESKMIVNKEFFINLGSNLANEKFTHSISSSYIRNLKF